MILDKIYDIVDRAYKKDIFPLIAAGWTMLPVVAIFFFVGIDSSGNLPSNVDKNVMYLIASVIALISYPFIRGIDFLVSAVSSFITRGRTVISDFLMGRLFTRPHGQPRFISLYSVIMLPIIVIFLIDLAASIVLAVSALIGLMFLARFCYDITEKFREHERQAEILRKSSWEYDENGRVIHYEHGDGHEEYYEYDDSGNLISHENSDGKKYQWKYDDLNRPIARRLYDPAENRYSRHSYYDISYDEDGKATYSRTRR